MKPSPIRRALKKILGHPLVRTPLESLLLRPTHRLEVFFAHEDIARGLTVKGGPFKGMLYPEANSHGSVLYPKLLGCYESELHPIIECIAQTDYSDVADIGAAEGYYAVGLALRLPHAHIHAYDIATEALKACGQMAECNHVDARVHLHGFCSPETLRDLAARSKKLLVVCDCEGFERELFTPDCITALEQSDILLETHDFLVPETLQTLKDRFAPTHVLEEITSLPDASRETLFHFQETRRLNSIWRTHVLSEFRPAKQTFLWMRAKA